MENNNCESKIDVRIVVSGLDIAQLVSKVVDNIHLEKNYNMVVSSIIPTTDLDIVRKVVGGADIILIGSYGHDDNFNMFFNDLKTDFNNIGLFDYNNIIVEDESMDLKLAEKEILNSIIKSTLSYSLNLINIHSLENRVTEITQKYNNLLEDYDKAVKENEILSLENKELYEDIDALKSDFSSFKSKYGDIHSKNILEIFKLDELWSESFGEEMIDAEKIAVATDNFKPDDIIVGQGYIGAASKMKAVEWLKIIKTALIFIEDNNNELAEDSTIVHEKKLSEVRDDYEIPDDFENFWD